jgi:hypothetical protein
VRRSPAAVDSVLASGQTSAKPIRPPRSPLTSGQPQYAVPLAAGFLEVGCRYASPASETEACKPVQRTTQRLPARYGTWGWATGTSRHVLGPGVSRGCCRASVVTRLPSFPYLPLGVSLPAAFFASPLISPPTSKRCPARGSRFVGGFVNPAKFVLVRKRKNATHATKTRNRYVRFFCNRILYRTSKRALSSGIPCALHRWLWREIWGFEVGVQGRRMRVSRVARRGAG